MVKRHCYFGVAGTDGAIEAAVADAHAEDQPAFVGCTRTRGNGVGRSHRHAAPTNARGASGESTPSGSPTAPARPQREIATLQPHQTHVQKGSASRWAGRCAGPGSKSGPVLPIRGPRHGVDVERSPRPPLVVGFGARSARGVAGLHEHGRVGGIWRPLGAGVTVVDTERFDISAEADLDLVGLYLHSSTLGGGSTSAPSSTLVLRPGLHLALSGEFVVTKELRL
jgi:hypothetical protein